MAKSVSRFASKAERASSPWRRERRDSGGAESGRDQLVGVLHRLDDQHPFLALLGQG